MKSLNIHISKKDKKALHLRVADAIRSSIINKQVLPNEPFPSSRELAAQLKIHRQTIMAGFEELIAEGWVVSLPRKGYAVANISALPIVHKTKTNETIAASAHHHWRWGKNIDLGPFQPKKIMTYNFQSGLPDLNLFPRKELQYHLSRVVKKASNPLLDYGSPAGVDTLIKAIDLHLRRVKNISDRTTIITNGSQEGIYISLQLLIKPGDHVGLEDPGYPPVRALLNSLGAKIIPLKMDQDGILPETFQAAIKKYNLRLLFLTPLHQFPTTVTLSAPRRLRVYEMAHQNQIPIIEDDYDHEFHYRTQPLTPMASEDPYGQVIYLGTLSKIMFPGARLGFMSVPKAFAENFLQYRRLTTHANETLIQQALAGWILDNGFERHINRMRRVYEKRLMVLEENLNSLKSAGKDISWSTPSGGMAIWLKTAMDSSQLAQNALSKNVFVTPEQYYRNDNKPGNHLRIGFSNLSEELIKAGIQELGKLLR